MRCLAFIAAKFQFFIYATHNKREHNVIADAPAAITWQITINSFPLSSGAPTSYRNPRSSPGSVNNQETRLDITYLDSIVEFYFLHGLAHPHESPTPRQSVATSVSVTYTTWSHSQHQNIISVNLCQHWPWKVYHTPHWRTTCLGLGTFTWRITWRIPTSVHWLI